MATKTITVTEEAYRALKSMKGSDESFSRTILRIARRKPLSSFYGVLSKESGERLETAVMDNRKRHKTSRKDRLKRISEELKGS